LRGSEGGQDWLELLDRAFQATNPEQYQNDDWRIARLLKLPESTYIAIPKIGAYGWAHRIRGRSHCALVAKQQGLKVIPGAVRKDNVAEVRQLLSKFRAPR
jgi:hypothetical protein